MFLSYPLPIITGMGFAHVEDAVALLEKANADLQPELLTASGARKLLDVYVRAQRLSAFGVAALARTLDDATKLAQVTGTSVGTAKDTVATGKALGQSEPLSTALQQGAVSLDQAAEIAKAEEASPGAAAELVAVAQKESFHVLKEQARKVKLEAEQHRDLAARQRAARGARSYNDELGMMHIHLALEPHVGTPIVARAEAEAARLARAARKNGGTNAGPSSGKNGSGNNGGRGVGLDGESEPFECHLADAYARLLSPSGSPTTQGRRPELVVLVSHGVAARGWKDVGDGEVCKIPGVGPVSPQVAKEIAKDAFLSGVFYDGKDLRQLRRWSRSIPVEVAIALELGAPPGFDGVACVDCGNRFRTEFDHVQPRAAHGPSSNGNLRPRCWSCHQAKTARDRKAGKLTPPDP